MDFWNKKLDSNVNRDKRDKSELRRMGWKVLVVWECEARDSKRLMKKLERFLINE